MLKFAFRTTKAVLVEAGSSARISDFVTELGARSVLIVTDKGIAAAGLLDPALASLKAKNIRADLFTEVLADPPEDVVMKAVQLAQQSGAECVIGLGGGSSMDVAKLVALLAKGGEKLDDIYGVGFARGPRLPLILVPTTDPGFSATPIHTVGGFSTTATYYDNIRVPVTNVVGKENEGWKLITTQLNHERVGLAAFSGICEAQLDEVREWLKDQVTADGTPLGDEPWVRSLLATSTARLRAMRLLNWKLVETTAQGSLDPGSASAAKVFATETVIDVYRSLLEIVGGTATRISDAPWNFDTGRLALMNLGAQINTFGGGVAEIQREIVAWTTLGMARSAR